MSTSVVQEAIGPVMDISEPSGYVHLLSLDEHSIQDPLGYQAAVLTVRKPYSFERWIRVAFSGTDPYVVQSIKFWANNLALPAGWDVRFGISDTYRAPSRAASSIATLPVPTIPPSGPNVSGLLMNGPGTNYSPWVVIQAHVTDFGAVQSGSLLGQTGTEVIVPTMIHYHFGWNES